MIQCEKPTLAYVDKDDLTVNGKPRLHFKIEDDWSFGLDGTIRNSCFHVVRPVDLPCGKCILCRKRRGFEIGIRARCEASLYKCSSFITLTVSDDFIDKVFPNGKLNHRAWQLFAKRLRKKIGSFRFLMCGEYGETTGRPHYHAILFGHHFSDCYFDSSGCWHGSRVLEECWPFGHVQVSLCNDNRLMYVAGYVIKISPQDLPPSYARWSRCPGLGAKWFDKFWRDVFACEGFDFDIGLHVITSAVIWHGKLVPFACRYFDNLLSLKDAELYARLKAFRTEKVGSSPVRDTKLAYDAFCRKLEILRRRLDLKKRDLQNSDYATSKLYQP